MKDALTTFWTDPAVAQRWIAGGALFGGYVLAHGGAVPLPTGEIVLPGLDRIYWMGPYLLLIGGVLGAGGALPSWFSNSTRLGSAKNGNGAPKP